MASLSEQTGADLSTRGWLSARSEPRHTCILQQCSAELPVLRSRGCPRSRVPNQGSQSSRHNPSNLPQQIVRTNPMVKGKLPHGLLRPLNHGHRAWLKHAPSMHGALVATAISAFAMHTSSLLPHSKAAYPTLRSQPAACSDTNEGSSNTNGERRGQQQQRRQAGSRRRRHHRRGRLRRRWATQGHDHQAATPGCHQVRDAACQGAKARTLHPRAPVLFAGTAPRGTSTGNFVIPLN